MGIQTVKGIDLPREFLLDLGIQKKNSGKNIAAENVTTLIFAIWFSRANEAIAGRSRKLGRKERSKQASIQVTLQILFHSKRNSSAKTELVPPVRDPDHRHVLREESFLPAS